MCILGSSCLYTHTSPTQPNPTQGAVLFLESCSPPDVVRMHTHVLRVTKEVYPSLTHGPPPCACVLFSCRLWLPQISLPVTEDYSHPCGVYNSTLAWCSIGDGALVKVSA